GSSADSSGSEGGRPFLERTRRSRCERPSHPPGVLLPDQRGPEALFGRYVPVVVGAAEGGVHPVHLAGELVVSVTVVKPAVSGFASVVAGADHGHSFATRGPGAL